MAEHDLSRRRYFGGIFALLGVVFIWVTSSFAMNVSLLAIPLHND
jgi:solute carrier family 35 protein F5